MIVEKMEKEQEFFAASDTPPREDTPDSPQANEGISDAERARQFAAAERRRKRSPLIEDPVQCLVCFKTLLSRRSLVRHVKRLHPSQVDEALPLIKSQRAERELKLVRRKRSFDDGDTESDSSTSGRVTATLPPPREMRRVEHAPVASSSSSAMFAPVVTVDRPFLKLRKLAQMCVKVLAEKRPFGKHAPRRIKHALKRPMRAPPAPLQE